MHGDWLAKAQKSSLHSTPERLLSFRKRSRIQLALPALLVLPSLRSEPIPTRKS